MDGCFKETVYVQIKASSPFLIGLHVFLYHYVSVAGMIRQIVFDHMENNESNGWDSSILEQCIDRLERCFNLILDKIQH